MPRIDPTLLEVLTDLARGLRELGVPFAVVGALVPELLLDARPSRMTNDADVTVIVDSLVAFEALKDRLNGYGFARTSVPHRLRHRDGGLADVLPFSEAIVPDGKLRFEDGVVLNMAGFSHVVPSAVSITLDTGLSIPLAPLPLYALLKLVAFSDRRAAKDLAGVLHCLRHYLDDDDRRYGAEHDGAGVPFEFTCAYLLGVDGRPFLDGATRVVVETVLAQLDDPHAASVGAIAREQGHVLIEDEHRTEIVELFRWYRLGVGL
jgi:predicted nucleotidyltransferase